MDSRMLCAIHEAGHAVICEALGYEVSVMEANSNGTGRTRHINPPTPWEQAVIAMAGPIAEQRFCGDDWDETGSRADYAKIVDISARCPDLAERCEFLVAVEQMARSRVRAYWDDIVQAAANLIG